MFGGGLQRRLRLEGGRLPSAKERTEGYRWGPQQEMESGTELQQGFLGRALLPFYRKGKHKCQGGSYTYLGSQRPKQGGEASQAADSFVHVQLQGLGWLGRVGQQGLALQDGF